MSSTIRQQMDEMFLAACRRVDPYRMIKDRVRLSGSKLTVKLEDEEIFFNLDEFSRIVVLGAGKATAKMALAVEEILAGRIAKAVIAVKPGHTETLRSTAMIEAGHPVPDAGSVEAGRTMAELCRDADEKTFIINLISGGGSALLSFPYAWKDAGGEHRLSLEDKQSVTKVLLACGATIQEINCIRKHLSGIKGGRLAELMYPATSLNLILSDVVGDRLDSIASGLTAPDDTTYADALALVEKYGIAGKLPEPALCVLRLGAEGKIPETPKAGSPVFSKVRNVIIGSNYGALLAAEAKARAYGYETVVLSAEITGEAREVAKTFIGIGRFVKQHGRPLKAPCCIIAGGETTVTLRGEGRGGRNQEMALSFLAEIENNPEGSKGIYFLSASTDGNDGPTDAAGAFADLEVLGASRAKKLSINDYLKRNDSNCFFDAIGFLEKCGATNTNVCDIHILTVV
jgi:glycerate 2-kinase